MSKHIGKVYGAYIVIGVSKNKYNGNHKMYLVQCMFCDVVREVQLSQVKYNKTKANMCCWHNADRKFVNTRLRNIFHGMLERCYNPQNQDFKTYGANGIGICTEWRKRPVLFEEWALSSGYDDGLTIDRIDSLKDYCPENCRWVSLEENARYKSTTILIEVDGEIYTGRQWAQRLNLGINTINSIRREFGDDKVKELIRRMLLRKPNIEVFRKGTQSWLDAYEIE